MKPSVPKLGLLSRIFIAVSLAVMAACSQEAAVPDPADEAIMNEAQREDDAELAGTPGQAEGTEAAAMPAAGTERRAGYASGTASMAPEGELSDLALTDGEWFLKDGEALFGPPESEATFSIGCNGDAGEVIMTRSIVIGEDEQLRLGLFTPSGNGAGYWRDAGDVMPLAMATLPASSEIFGKIAASERFAVGAEGEPPLVLPVSDGLREVIEACTG